MYGKILVANDGSPGALRALGIALELAKREGAALHMVTVEELPWFPASIDEVEEEKAEANHRLAPLIETARTRLYEQIIGSTTERLVRLAPCTILVVK